jgi:Leucine-rich repeat (LRR) protein
MLTKSSFTAILAYAAWFCLSNGMVARAGIVLDRAYLEQRYNSSLASSTKLLLSYKQIESIHPATFTNLTNLRFLYLDNNLLSASLDPALFNGLINLHTLSLNDNQFNGLLVAGMFNGLRNLQYLWLQNNKFSGGLTTGVFKDSVGLKILDLSNNNFASISEGAFKSLDKLEYLDLSGNKFSVPINPQLFNGLNPACQIIF